VLDKVMTESSVPRQVTAPQYPANLISIILCTRNRASQLKRTLQAIAALEVPAGVSCEIIVVDNGSTDETREICSQMEYALGGRLRRIFLKTPGLSRAGNAGFAAARGGIIAFLDDDVLPGQNWLCVVWEEFSTHPLVGAITGRVELFEPSALFTTTRLESSRTPFDSIGHAFNLFIGCNLAVRRTLIETVGLFDEDLGTGTRFGSAGDSDFFYRAWKAGEKLLYVPSLSVQHDHQRHSEEDRLKLAKVYLVGRGAFYAKHVLRRDGTAARGIYWELREASRALFERKDRLGWRHGFWLLSGFLRYSMFKLIRVPAAGSASSAPASQNTTTDKRG
jgi:glycosyltransferase involved in cell wall biosynthesis